MTRGFGHIPDGVDERDLRFSARRPMHAARAVEERFDNLVRRVRDQLATSSCVGNSGGTILEARAALDGKPYVPVSALDLYWNARAVDGYQHEDAGAMIRSAAKIAHGVGIASESAWPFDEERVNMRPSIEADVDGVTRCDGTYERITETGADRVEQVLDALQSRFPVWFGTLVGDRFMEAAGDDTIPAPGASDIIRGGHALAALGFDRSGERIRIVNSWNTSWGDNGFAWIASEWMSYPGTTDIWVLRPRQVEVPNA